MRKRNERTLQFKQYYIENYREIVEAGKGPKDIAPMFQLSTWTAYSMLQEIADELGVPRDNLLKTPHGPHISYERQYEPVKPVDLGKLKSIVDTTIADIEAVCSMIDNDIEWQECLAKEYSGGVV